MIAQATLAQFAGLRAEGYTLYRREVFLKGGGMQAIHFFAKGTPLTGVPADMLPGYEIVPGRRGLAPVMRRCY